LGRRAVIALALVAASIALSGTPSRASSPGIVLGWNYGGSTATYLAQDARAPGLNVVSPSWWLLRSNGTIADTGSSSYVAWAHAHGMRVWPMFVNGLDQTSSRHAMTDAALRTRVIATVRDLARRYVVDGINVDWENLATSDRDSFSAFVRQAATTWRTSGLTTSVDISARTEYWQLGNWSESFDQRALGAAADYVVLMAYDEHNRLRPDGPTASLGWVTDSVRYLLRTTPASKVILGVPFYTNDWDDNTRKASVVTYAETAAHIRAHHAVVGWDPRAGSSLAKYRLAGHTHHMWFDDAKSLSLKAALAPKYGLAGVAAWRIGFETPDAWRAIEAAPVARPVPATPIETVPPTPRVTPQPATAAPVRVVAAPLPPVKPTSRHVTFPFIAAIAAFLVAGGVTFAERRAKRRPR
jgi:spore germination protein YaaH